MMLPTHVSTPGSVLRDRFLAPLGLDAAHLAAATGMSVGLIEGVLGDAVRIDDEIAACLGDFLSTDARFWTGLQSRADRGLLPA